jgi:multiple sugar transport system substrate-binding protein
MKGQMILPNNRLNRRDFLRLGGVTAGAALLAACGSQPTATQVPAATQAPAVLPTAPPAAGGLTFKGTLDAWDWEFPVRETLVKNAIQEWQGMNPDIKINYLVLPWADIETKILAAGTAKNGPPISDVMYFWRYDLQRAGVIVPFPDDFADWDDRLSTPFMKDENGKVRAFPSGWYVDMIYYNKDIFEKEGIKATDIPTNWDDFIKLAQQLTQTDKDGKVTRAGCAMNDYWQHEYLWQGLIYQQGGWMYNEAGDQALWEADESVKSLQFIQDWYNKHKIDSRELPEGYGGFCNDLAVMFLGSGWNTGFFMNDFPQMEGRWDTVKIPTFTGKPTPSYGLASPEENFQAFSYFSEETIEASFAFIKHVMAGEEQSYEWATAQSCAPDSKKVAADPRILEIPGIRSQAETMPYRVCFGERPIEAEKLWRTMFDQVILENMDPKAALKEANTAINQVLPTKKRYITERNYKPPA